MGRATAILIVVVGLVAARAPARATTCVAPEPPFPELLVAPRVGDSAPANTSVWLRAPVGPVELRTFVGEVIPTRRVDHADIVRLIPQELLADGRYVAWSTSTGPIGIFDVGAPATDTPPPAPEVLGWGRSGGGGGDCAGPRTLTIQFDTPAPLVAAQFVPGPFDEEDLDLGLLGGIDHFGRALDFRLERNLTDPHPNRFRVVAVDLAGQPSEFTWVKGFACTSAGGAPGLAWLFLLLVGLRRGRSSRRGGRRAPSSPRPGGSCPRPSHRPPRSAAPSPRRR